jgi:hypothetical protein
VIVLAFVVGFVLLAMFGGVFGRAFGGVSGLGSAGFICIPILFIILVAALGLYRQFSGHRTIPPPPPIQQRMVPAGQQGPVTLDCPNCGGPPSNVDRFGIAVCSYCGTRYLVR